MPAPDERKPLLTGRGVLLAADFCAATGLAEATVARLVADETLDGLTRLDGDVLGLFDDTLPTADDLRALGLTVLDSYDPEPLRSHRVAGTEHGDDDHHEGSVGPSWSMHWPDQPHPDPAS